MNYFQHGQPLFLLTLEMGTTMNLLTHLAAVKAYAQIPIQCMAVRTAWAVGTAWAKGQWPHHCLYSPSKVLWLAIWQFSD